MQIQIHVYVFLCTYIQHINTYIHTCVFYVYIYVCVYIYMCKCVCNCNIFFAKLKTKCRSSLDISRKFSVYILFLKLYCQLTALIKECSSNECSSWKRKTSIFVKKSTKCGVNQYPAH